MAHYFRCHQQSDGGWGTHLESPSTMFGTTLAYVALRALGARADERALCRAREFVRSHGGAMYTSSWAKFYLCLLGVLSWEGHNSIPPEMWLLPDWFPLHPGRMWCHCRMVYLPMGYLYGTRHTYSGAMPDPAGGGAGATRDPLVAALREELLLEDYATADWALCRHVVAEIDNYSPIGRLMAVMQDVMAVYERRGGWFKRAARRRGLAFCLDYIRAEDVQTNYVDIGPVNKVLNMLVVWAATRVEGGGGDAGGAPAYPPRAECATDEFKKHCLRVPDYLWVAEDGMKMQGYNGSQCWDTSFAVQAVIEAGLADEFPELCARTYAYLERTQILSTPTSAASAALGFERREMRRKYYRHVSFGGWPFSTSAHGWPISDCTAEGLKAILLLRERACVARALADAGAGAGGEDALRPFGDARADAAVNVLLALQNADGGWATYENNRGFGWYEALNPSEVFGDIMIDYSYVECSNAALSALALYLKHRDARGDGASVPRRRHIEYALAQGNRFVRALQRADGSWYGSWGCCFTYAAWFGVEALVATGEKPGVSEPLARACTFLLAKQNANGGWGEDFTSCFDKDYAPEGMVAWGDGGSGVVNTAWALLALMEARCADVGAVRRGVAYLRAKQRDDGDWAQEGIAGVFNRACGISYTAYRNIFPIWALGRYARHYEPEVARASS